MKLGRLGLFGAGLLSLVLSQSQARADTAPMSRQEIIQLGESVVGYSYWWGGATWDPSGVEYPGRCEGAGCPNCSHSASTGGPEYGADCSGLVGHAWKLVSDTPLKGGHAPYATSHYLAGTEHWSRIDRADLLPGDALVHPGHIVLFESWASDGTPNLFECAGCQIGCVRSTRQLGSDYVAIRRTGVDSSVPPGNGETGGELTQASCEGLSGWAVAGDEPVEVVFSFDAPSDSYFGKRTTITADENGSFELPFPEAFKDGKRHAVYAYVVDGDDETLLIGAPVVIRCADTGTTSLECGHGVCEAGAALESSCNACTSNVCATQPSCCSSSWDQSCVDLVGETQGSCAGECAGGPSTCEHDECSAGSALTASCSSCAESVCANDEYCCEGEWDWICAKEAAGNAYCACKS